MQFPERWLVALAAACSLAGPGAAATVEVPHGVEYRSAPRSALVSRREVGFLIAKWQEGTQSTTILARPQGSSPVVVARLMRSGEGNHLLVSVQTLSSRRHGVGSAEMDMAALEQLYSLVLQQEPQARFCLGSGDVPCDPRSGSASHAQVLQALAHRRQALATRVQGAVPWKVVEMQAASAAGESEDDDTVSIGAKTSEGPLKGVELYFNRAPHSICSAHTGADGVATCRLQDQHGDGDHHEHAGAVVVTYPGDLRMDRVLLPTTHVLPTVVPSESVGHPAAPRRRP